MVIIAFAINTWYVIKQTLPLRMKPLRLQASSGHGILLYPGKDGKLGSPDDVSTMDELHIKVGKSTTLNLSQKMCMIFGTCLSFKARYDSRPHHYGVVQSY